MKRNFFSIPFAFLFLGLFISSCSVQDTNVAPDPTPSAKQVVDQNMFYSRIEGSETHVYAMRFVEYSNGTAEAHRSIVAYNSNYEYIGGQLRDAESIEQNGSMAVATYGSTAWFIPFNPSSPARVANGGGTITVECTCQGSGNCDFSGTITSGGDLDFKCVSRDCDNSCGGKITPGIANPWTGGYGVVSAVSQVAVY